MSYLTVGQAAKRLRVTEARVRQLCREKVFGRLVGPFEDRWAITAAEIAAFEQQRRKPGRPPKTKQP